MADHTEDGSGPSLRGRFIDYIENAGDGHTWIFTWRSNLFIAKTIIKVNKFAADFCFITKVAKILSL